MRYRSALVDEQAVVARSGRRMGRRLIAWALRPVRRRYSALVGLRNRLWRLGLIARVRVLAYMVHASVDLDVAPDVGLGRRVKVRVDQGSTNRLTMCSGSRLEDDVFIWLRGGRIEIGPGTEVRRRCTMDSSGLLRIGGDTVLSWGAVLHCAKELVIG